MAKHAIYWRRLDCEGSDACRVASESGGWRIKPLVQTYRRIGPRRYAYASPAHGYRAELKTDDFGMVTLYPKLWRAAG